MESSGNTTGVYHFSQVVVVKPEVRAGLLSTGIHKEDHMNTATRVKDYSSLFAEFASYLREKKSYWLAPIIFVLMALSALAFFLEGSVLAPAIYSVF